jgi:hypothetical protein
MKNLSFFLLSLSLLLLASSAWAQFSTTAATTQFVCNAPGNQFGVQALPDGAGGSFVVWIDKRNGNNSGLGTGIYAQHLNAAGVALLASNGKRLFQTGSRDIFGLKVVPWQYGYLVAWPTARCPPSSTRASKGSILCPPLRAPPSPTRWP